MIVAPPKPQGCKRSSLQELWKKKIQATRDSSDPKLELSCEDLWKKFKSSYNLSDPKSWNSLVKICGKSSSPVTTRVTHDKTTELEVK